MSGKDYCNCEQALLLRGALHSALMTLTSPRPSSHDRAVEIISAALRTDRAMQEAYEDLEGLIREATTPDTRQGWGHSRESERASRIASGDDPGRGR